LLRADNLFAHPIAAAVAISSKSIFQFREKHLFNPATFGVVFAISFLPGTWVSPGQWGQDFAIAGWVAMLGILVTQRARRADISWTFLGFYLGALAIRIAYLGQRWAVWTHQLESGALLLFAFFMISDPMTAPNSRRGRIAHAALVAAIAYAWQVELYRTNGLIWALFMAAPAVPLWDALWSARKFEWSQNGGGDETVSVSKTDARDVLVGRSDALRAA
jgi:Na+-transporting NADH:ubiquinone oxidoreductase subunit NqrB